MDFTGEGLFWTGLTDFAKEGTYVWQDGTIATYFDWASGEPNDFEGTSDCVLIDSAMKNRQWTDSGCFSYNVYAFCQYP